ncbi:hypothetical protein Q5P01_018041 [Channa striata]|uniref:Uncharacterized protein n=1 Tax=Channa striata TaxID=64152 RepID=A0AA88M3Q3_CHASR|nr:hypothetical protein Q5P01_018041 [Channa striata]
MEANGHKDDDSSCKRAVLMTSPSPDSALLSFPSSFTSALIPRSFPLLWLLDNASPQKTIIVSECLSVVECSCESGWVYVSEFWCVCVSVCVCVCVCLCVCVLLV